MERSIYVIGDPKVIEHAKSIYNLLQFLLKQSCRIIDFILHNVKFVYFHVSNKQINYSFGSHLSCKLN